MIADADSSGFHWVYVELESPNVPISIGTGEYAERARRGFFQIRTWRNFVDQNGDHASRPRDQGGLGLPYIRSKDWGIVLVGRRAALGEDRGDLRQQSDKEEQVAITPTTGSWSGSSR